MDRPKCRFCSLPLDLDLGASFGEGDDVYWRCVGGGVPEPDEDFWKRWNSLSKVVKDILVNELKKLGVNP